MLQKDFAFLCSSVDVGHWCLIVACHVLQRLEYRLTLDQGTIGVELLAVHDLDGPLFGNLQILPLLLNTLKHFK